MQHGKTSRMRIVIAGGGPAGSSLAIRCAGAGHEVTLIEKEIFPREKLCGEFISPECVGHFKELGVMGEMLAKGAQTITETRFYSTSGRAAAVPCEWMGGEALGLSRARMDTVLLNAARDRGVRVIEGGKLARVNVEDRRITNIEVTHGGERLVLEGDLFVDASGRAAALRRLAGREAGDEETKPERASYLGFKVHMAGTGLRAGRCEMYIFRGGYAGLSSVENGLSNLCFLIDTKTARKFGADGETLLKEAICENPRALEVIAGAGTVGRWLTVAVRRFGRLPAIRFENLVAAGDAASFIDPFTGSGMLIAFQSSKLLADCLIESPERLNERYDAVHSRHFGRRFRAAAALRQAALQPLVASTAIATVFRSRRLRRSFTKWTR